MYSVDILKPSRDLVRLVQITLDRCANVYGVSPCTASGGQCYYSWASCEDQPNFNRATRDYFFSSQQAGSVLAGQGVLPYLHDVTPLTTEIDSERSVTVDTRMEFVFVDDENPAPPDHDKGVGVHGSDRQGSFWKNLVQRNPNFRYRRIRLYEGLAGYTSLDEFQLKFDGILSNVEFMRGGRVRVTATDHYRRFKNSKLPQAVSSQNTLQSNVTSGVAALTVADGSEFKLIRHGTLWTVTQNMTAGVQSQTLEIGDWDFASETVDAGYTGQVWGLCYVPEDDAFYFSDNMFGSAVLYKMDRVTGAITTIGSLSPGIQITGLAWDEINKIMYATNTGMLYTVNRITAGTTTIGSHSVPYDLVYGLSWNALDGKLYGIDNHVADSLVEVNKSTGATTLVSGALGLGTITVRGLCHDRINNKFYCSDWLNNDLIQIDPATGAGTLVMNSSGSLYLEHVTLQQDACVLIEDNSAGDEYCRLLGVNGNVLSVTRGVYGSAAVAHDAGVKIKQVAAFANRDDTVTTKIGISPVDAILDIIHLWVGVPYKFIDWQSFVSERDNWANGLSVRRLLEVPVTAETLVKQLRQVVYGDVWQREDQRLTCRIVHPVGPHDSAVSLEETNDLVIDESTVNLNTESQVTRLHVYYAPADAWGRKEHRSADDFSALAVTVRADIEGPNQVDDVWPAERFSDWIFRHREARILASRYLRRYAEPPAMYEFMLDRKDSAIATGDVIDISTSDFVNHDGSDSTLNVQVVRKQESSNGLVRLKTLQTQFSLRYGFIAHSGAADYGVASDDEKRHSYIGDSSGKVSGGSENGYYVF